MRDTADQIGLSSVLDLEEVFGWPCSCGENVAGVLVRDASRAETELHECQACGVTVVAEDLEGGLEVTDEF